MKTLYPLKTKHNRCWRCYLGGKLIDVMYGNKNPADGYFPEDWLASTVVAVNPDREGKPEFEGLSVAILAPPYKFRKHLQAVRKRQAQQH